MSFYGKKALVWWDYNDFSKESLIRYAHTDEEKQLEILKKWYPIGTKIRTYNILGGDFSKTIWEIDGYEKTQWGWALSYKNDNDCENVKVWLHRGKTKPFYRPLNPHRCKVLEEYQIKIKREHKLNRIL